MPMNVFITDSEEDGDQEEEMIQQPSERGALERDAALEDQHQHQHQHQPEVADQSGDGVIAATKVAWASGTEDESEGFPAVDLEREVERRKASPGGSSTYDVQLRKLKMQVILSLPLPGGKMCGRVAFSSAWPRVVQQSLATSTWPATAVPPATQNTTNTTTQRAQGRPLHQLNQSHDEKLREAAVKTRTKYQVPRRLS